MNIASNTPQEVFVRRAASVVDGIDGARALRENHCDVVINWSGGMHGSRQASCRGFAPINDCVLAILELLQTYDRVLYVDLDADPASGVEEAFYTCDRVLTCSFHAAQERGNRLDIGVEGGKGFAVNVPLPSLSDAQMETLVDKVVYAAYDAFEPNAIVVQAGANSLFGDRMGQMNHSMYSHGHCLMRLNALCLPMLVLGGSGYTLRNTARCWAYETALLVGQTIPRTIPRQETYREHYGPDYSSAAETGFVEHVDASALERLIQQTVQSLALCKATRSKDKNCNK